MRPEAVTPPPQKEWCPANMAAVFGLFMGSVAICNVSSLQVLRWFFASSLLELCVAREVWSHWGIWAAKMVTKNAAGGVFAEGPPSYLAKVSARNLFLPAVGTRNATGPYREASPVSLEAHFCGILRFLVPFWVELDPKGGPKIMFLDIMLEK